LSFFCLAASTLHSTPHTPTHIRPSWASALPSPFAQRAPSYSLPRRCPAAAVVAAVALRRCPCSSSRPGCSSQPRGRTRCGTPASPSPPPSPGLQSHCQEAPRPPCHWVALRRSRRSINAADAVAPSLVSGGAQLVRLGRVERSRLGGRRCT
jgi:hypothetical protein